MNIVEINPENISKNTADLFRVRKAVRAVLFDNENKIALLHVRKHSYHKLPGGGVEKGENTEDALVRECLEETGCNIEIGKEVGRIIEYRGKFKLKQESLCFIAKVEGDKGQTTFTNKETLDEFELIWVELDQVEKILKVDLPTDYEGKFIKVRDRIFIRYAMKVIQ